MDSETWSEIEKYLFHDEETTHGLTGLTLEEDRILIRIGPWTVGNETDDVIPAMGKEVEAEFSRTELLLLKVTGEKPEDLTMPWIITSFHSIEMKDGIYRFILLTDALEITFSGRWPEIFQGD